MTAYYNEHDPYAAAWLRNLIAAGHIAPGDVDERDIRDVRPDDIRSYRQCHFFAGIGVWSYALRLAGWPDDRPIWTGSCPCQPFSAAGKGGGFADERHLWPAFFHLIGECRPSVVLGEQVASKDGLQWLDLVQDDMEGASYAFGAVDTSSALHGAPHIRQRLRWVAYATEPRWQSWWRLTDQSDGREPSRFEPGRLCDAVNVAHTSRARLEGRDEGTMGHECLPAERSGGAVRLADANGGHASTEGLQRSREHGQQPEDAISGNVERLGAPGHNAGVKWGEYRQPRPGPTNGFWRDPDWLFCRDGRWRPVEPGTFPLVDGSAFRMGSGSSFEGKSRSGMLKGAGNAVDAEATAAFCNAVRGFL